MMSKVLKGLNFIYLFTDFTSKITDKRVLVIVIIRRAFHVKVLDQLQPGFKNTLNSFTMNIACGFG